MSPDGQKLAVGVSDDGERYIDDLETGSSIRLVSELIL